MIEATLTTLAFIGSVGPQEIFVIVVLIALLFGMKQLPKIGKSLGEGIREFRRAGKAITEELDEVKNDLKDDMKDA